MSDRVTCSEAGAQLDPQALTFAGRSSNKDPCIGLLARQCQGHCWTSLCLPASGSASPKKEFGGKGLVFKVLCVRCQPGVVNSAWSLCSEKVQSCHWQHFSIKARAGNLLAWRAGLLGAAAVGGKSLCGAHVINKLKGSSTAVSLSWCSFCSMQRLGGIPS